MKWLIACCLLVAACDDSPSSMMDLAQPAGTCAQYTASNQTEPSGACTAGESCHDFELSCVCCSNNTWSCGGGVPRDGGSVLCH